MRTMLVHAANVFCDIGIVYKDLYRVKSVLKTTCIEGAPVYKDHCDNRLVWESLKHNTIAPLQKDCLSTSPCPISGHYTQVSL